MIKKKETHQVCMFHLSFDLDKGKLYEDNGHLKKKCKKK